MDASLESGISFEKCCSSLGNKENWISNAEGSSANCSPWPGRPSASGRIVSFVHDEDCDYKRELEALSRLEYENRRPGADLRDGALRIVNRPELRTWLSASDDLSDRRRTKCRSDLARHRRLGILRLLEGEDRGFPIDQPFPGNPLPANQGFWLLRLRDELEWLAMPIYLPSKTRPYPRPIKDRLNHREARAILDWKASHLDMWLADRPHLVGGRIAIDSSRGVLFDTDGFMRWVYAFMN